MQPLHILTQIQEDLSIDFIEGVPRSQGFNCIMVIIDRQVCPLYTYEASIHDVNNNINFHQRNNQTL